VDRVRAIADAVLYEGYVLWPYRRSATKNQQRWTFGGVYPRAWSEAGHPDDACVQQTQCLLSGAQAVLDVRVRFLHVVERQVLERIDDSLRPIDALELAGERYLSWQEAAEREVHVGPLSLRSLQRERRIAIEVPAGRRIEHLRNAVGRQIGALERSWLALSGTLALANERLDDELQRITLRVSNDSRYRGGGRAQAQRQAFCSTHAVLATRAGEFASLTDPPAALAAAAAACENVGTWPVLAGEKGDTSLLLSSPIILPDHPQIAPESPGDLFDSGEIDQMLVLNLLTLTEEERREVRATDPRTREILERTEALTSEELMRLHGTIREFGLAR
jgi:hypothetical protein